MLRHLTATALAAGLLTSAAASAQAAPTTQCRDQKGHFIACAKPAVATNQRCRSSTGKFVKCPTSGVAALTRSTVKR